MLSKKSWLTSDCSGQKFSPLYREVDERAAYTMLSMRIATAILSLSLCCSATAKAADDGRMLLMQAADAVAFANSSDKPIEIDGSVQIFGLTTGTASGSWRLAMARDDRTLISVHFPNYSGDFWTRGALKFSKQSSQFTPLPVDHLSQVLNLEALLESALQGKDFKVQSKKIHDVKIQCVTAYAKGDDQILEACLDSAFHPVTIRIMNTEWSFSDYQAVGSRKFPRELVATEKGVQRIKAKITEVKNVTDSTEIDPPPTVQAEAGLRCSSPVLEGHLKTRVQPEYPYAARVQREQGTVILGAIISKAGTISKLTVLQSAGKMLDDAAMEAVRKWEYVPYVCDGQAVEVRTAITVNFNIGY